MSVRRDIGKEAITNIHPISYNDKYSLIKVNIETGRTHQIRVHLKSIHHDIVGDVLYGRKNRSINMNKQLLHAYSLEFTHPITGNVIYVNCKPYNYFKDSILKLKIPINKYMKEYIL